jgi:hypothetical protein
MPITINGSGSITGANTFTSNASFSGTLGVAGTANVAQGLSTASGGISPGSMPSGCIIQVVQTVYASTTSLSGSAGDFRNFTGLDTTVIPRASGSKFLIMYNLRVGTYQYSRRVVLKINGSYYNTISSDGYRASSGSYYMTAGALSDASIFEHTGEYLFTNSGTNNIAISFEIFNQDSNVVYINRSYSYDDTTRGRPTSTLTIMEIVS